MFITITDASKGKPHHQPEKADWRQISIKSISERVGWYNIKAELEWRYTSQGGQPSDPITIEPGLYNFDTLVETLTSEIDGFEINVNKNTGKISMTVPAEYEIWLPDPVKKILGIDDEDWLSTGEYIGDHSVEFSPQRIEIYLRQLSSTVNFYSNRNGHLSPSNLLGFIPLTMGGLGEYFITSIENPYMRKLENGGIHKLDFDFKVVWRNCTEKLDNHNQPLDLELILLK